MALSDALITQHKVTVCVGTVKQAELDTQNWHTMKIPRKRGAAPPLQASQPHKQPRHHAV